MYPWSRNRLWAVNLRLSAFEEVVPKDGEGGGGVVPPLVGSGGNETR